MPSPLLLGLLLTVAPSNPHVTGKIWSKYKSFNGGAINCIVIDPRNPENVYAGTEYEGVFKSTNGGKTWGEANDGIHESWKWITSMAIDPQNPEILYAGTE